MKKIKITEYKQRVKDLIQGNDIEEYLRERIYKAATQADQKDLVDYCDGDFKFIVHFQFEGQDWYDNGWVTELKKLLPKEIIERNKLAVCFFQ